MTIDYSSIGYHKALRYPSIISSVLGVAIGVMLVLAWGDVFRAGSSMSVGASYEERSQECHKEWNTIWRFGGLVHGNRQKHTCTWARDARNSKVRFVGLHSQCANSSRLWRQVGSGATRMPDASAFAAIGAQAAKQVHGGLVLRCRWWTTALDCLWCCRRPWLTAISWPFKKHFLEFAKRFSSTWAVAKSMVA